MRKYLLPSAILLTMLLLISCAAPAPVVPPPEEASTPNAQPAQTEAAQLSVPTFQLAELPQLEPYTAPREIIRRYYDEEFVDTLRPADDYGRLYPYEGKIFGMEWWENRVYYGLADEQGRVVVDAVYRYAYLTAPEENNGETYLVLAYPVDNDDTKAQDLLGKSDGWIQRGRFVIASPDGSWVSDFFYGDNLTVSGNRAIITNYSEKPEHMWSNQGQTYQIYDMQGQLIASGEGWLNFFSDGLASLSYTINSDNEQHYCYIDTDGNVAIPGPFLEASNFYEGSAVVAVGTNWYNRMSAVINMQGEYIVEPSTERLSGGYFRENYTIFGTAANNGKFGIKDMQGNIVVPAIYDWINLPYEEGATLAVASKSDNSWWLINLQNGDTKPIEIENATIIHVRVFGNNWCEVNYDGGSALLKDDKLYRFDSVVDKQMYARYISDQLFAINGTNYDEQNHATYYFDIFDPEQGKVLHTATGVQFSHVVGKLIVVNHSVNFEYMRALNLDTTPAFNGELANTPIRSIGLVADDVYSVRTTMFSGLIRENGEWLLRINTNTLD